jgi:prephenate dehydrogenase
VAEVLFKRLVMIGIGHIGASITRTLRAVRWGDAGYIEDKINRSRKIRKSLIDIKQA